MENKKEVIKTSLPFKRESVKITPETVKKYQFMRDRRDIGTSWVNDYKKLLGQGINLFRVISINRRQTGDILIDGNHRMEAFAQLCESNPNKRFEFECEQEVYDNLSDEEMKQKFDELNGGKVVSMNNMLQVHYKDFQFIKNCQDYGFPCKIVVSDVVEGIQLKTILSAFAAAQKCETGKFTPYTLGKRTIIGFGANLQYQDYKNMKEFIEFFIPIFGKINKNNMYIRPHVFVPLFHIFIVNRIHENEPNFTSRFKRLVGESIILNHASGGGGRIQTTRCRDDMIRFLNVGCSKNLFV